MQPSFEQFIRERQYLANVTPATIEWYKDSFKWLRTESPSQEDLKDAVMRMRAKGRKATGCNSAIQAFNTYAHWAHAGSDSKCGSGCTHPKVAHLKVPDLVLPTFTDQQIRQLVTLKPTRKYQRRLHTLIHLCHLRHAEGPCKQAPGSQRRLRTDTGSSRTTDRRS
jgi:integrase/recombinase XerD